MRDVPFDCALTLLLALACSLACLVPRFALLSPLALDAWLLHPQTMAWCRVRHPAQLHSPSPQPRRRRRWSSWIVSSSTVRANRIESHRSRHICCEVRRVAHAILSLPVVVVFVARLSALLAQPVDIPSAAELAALNDAEHQTRMREMRTLEAAMEQDDWSYQ